MIGERIDDPFRRALALDDVPIEAADTQRREPLAHLALDALGAAAEVADARGAAARAARRHGPRPSAVVASERAARLVIDERPRAIRARRHVAAVAAEHDRGRAAP